ncbi:DUF4350 domain-containing protein [Streptomyces bohaiensis]|uniref:DUF4350 domain-containing protein n=2 Tax=Streptomyces bohaiensis TaxID=1431344 RepID=UPI001ADD8312|nr:DUF4350 domain-containing protein [Streptomyces bohaiensis]
MTAAATAVSPDARALWRGGRGPLLGVVLVLLAGLALAVLRSGDGGALRHDSPTPEGALALTTLLAEEGVTTTPVGTAARAGRELGPETTLLVAFPNAVPPSRLTDLRREAARAGARLVLVSPGEEAVSRVAPGVALAGEAELRDREPGCEDPTARRAGSATLGGRVLDLSAADDAAACYGEGPLATVAVLGATDGPDGTRAETVLLGSPEFLTNDALADDGNAALATGLLGSRADLLWYVPDGSEPPPEQDEQSLFDLAGDNWRWAAGQLAIAVLLAAVWRMRRLGPAVPERLPVRIRAAETTEGRARLYHRAGARGRAADALRESARAHLAPLVGVRSGADVAELVRAVGDRTGRPAAEVTALLAGPEPTDDPALIALADDLDALRNQVAQHPGTTAAPTAVSPEHPPAAPGRPPAPPKKDTP